MLTSNLFNSDLNKNKDEERSEFLDVVSDAKSLGNQTHGVRDFVRSQDLRSASVAELENILEPLARKNPHLQEYIRRSRLLAQTKAPLTKSLLQLQSLPNILVIDLEATCFSDINYAGPHDVLEIGAVIFDCAQLKEIDAIQWYTKPTQTEVSDFCTSLTKITSERVENAPAFKQRIEELNRYISDNQIQVWGSYGGYDKNQFIRQCEREGLENPMAKVEHINIKDLVATHLGFKKKQPGLRRAMDLSNLEMQGVHHCGADDARNIGSLLKKVFIDNGMDLAVKKAINLRM